MTTQENVRYYYSRIEVADMLGVSYVTVDRLVKSGKLHCSRIGKRVLFTLSDVQSLMREVDTINA